MSEETESEIDFSDDERAGEYLAAAVRGRAATMNNPPETSTPRTDALVKSSVPTSPSGWFELAHLSHTLEVELAASNAKLAEWRDVAKDLVLVVENANCSCSLLRGDCSRCAALTRFNNLNTTEK